MHSVYLLTNTDTGKAYVGKTGGSVDRRWYRHAYDAKRGSPFILHDAIREHGPDAFRREVLVAGLSAEAATQAEREWIAKLGTVAPAGYNRYESGGGGAVGFKHSEKELAKRSARERARWQDPAFRAERAAALAALVAAGATPEVRAKIAAANRTPEARAASSAHWKAVHARPETKAKQSAAIKAAKATATGKARTAEGAAKRSAIWASRTHCRRGHELTPENIYRPTPTTRVCRTCENARHRATPP